MHMDSIPHAKNEPKWIIFRGVLPTHLSGGRLPNLPFATSNADTDQTDSHTVLNTRQEHAVRIFTEAIEKEGATYAGYIQCLCVA